MVGEIADEMGQTMTTASTAGAEQYAEVAVAAASQQRGEPDWLRDDMVITDPEYLTGPWKVTWI